MQVGRLKISWVPKVLWNIQQNNWHNQNQLNSNVKDDKTYRVSIINSFCSTQSMNCIVHNEVIYIISIGYWRICNNQFLLSFISGGNLGKNSTVAIYLHIPPIAWEDCDISPETDRYNYNTSIFYSNMYIYKLQVGSVGCCATRTWFESSVKRHDLLCHTVEHFSKDSTTTRTNRN